MNEALAALGVTIDDLNGGDDLIFDGIIVMNDGRTFGPDNTGVSVQGGAGFDGIFRFIKPLLCSSNLEGSYDFTSTAAGPWGCTSVISGTVRFESVGDGDYAIYTTPGGSVEFADAAFGVYFPCYGYDVDDPGAQGGMPSATLETAADLTIVDACNKLSWKGASQWGEVYSFNSVSVSGNELTLDWVNDYGEGGVTVITNPEGWPNLK